MAMKLTQYIVILFCLFQLSCKPAVMLIKMSSDLRKKRKPPKPFIFTMYSGTILNSDGNNAETTPVGGSLEYFMSRKMLISVCFEFDYWFARYYQDPYFLSVNFLLHPLRNSSFDPFIGIGIVNGTSLDFKSETDDRYFTDYAFILGLNIWTGRLFGFKLQARCYHDDSLQDYSLSTGVSFRFHTAGKKQ